MNKKLLALAVTSALAGVSAGVNADTANVNVYGKFFIQAQTVSGKGGTDPADNLVSHQEVNDPNSYIGFKGEDNIGGGMKGWFQVEQTVQADDAGRATAATSTDGKWGTRNSAVGLSGGFGNVFLGRWDTVYKQLGDPASFLGVSAGNIVSTSNVLSKPALDASDASFHLRRSNYIEYDSPTIAGFTIMAGYGPDEGKTLAKNASLQSVGVKFEQGPLYVALANERHNDLFTISDLFGGAAGTDSKDTGTRFSAMYKLPTNTTLGIDIANIEYKESAAAIGIGKAEHKAISLVVTQQLGKIGLAAGLVKANKGKVDGTEIAGSEGQQINLGVKYDFSKRTSVYAIYSKLTNKEDAQFNNLIQGDVGLGVDPEQFGAGIVVSF